MIALGDQRRQEEARQRVLREQHRSEVAQRRSAQALAEAKAEARRRLEPITQRFSGYRAKASDAGIPVPADLTEQVAALPRAIADATERQAVVRLARTMATLNYTIAEREGRIAADRLQMIGARLDAVEASMTVVPADTRLRLDRQGHEEAVELLRRARSLAPTDPAAALQRAEAAATVIREHLSVVIARKSEEDEKEDRARSLIREAQARLDRLDVDARAAGLPAPSRSEADQELAQQRAALVRGTPALVEAAAPRLSSLITRLEQDLDQAIGRLAARRELMASIVTALPAAGYAVSQDSIVESADGALGLRAFSLAGNGLSVLVQEGTDHAPLVLYGTDELTAEVADGTAEGRACPPLLEVIEQLGTEIRRAGFVPSDITWDDGNRPPPGHRARARAQEQPRTRGESG
jgi:hypothetical protein